MPLPLRRERQDVSFSETRRKNRERDVIELVDGRIEIARTRLDDPVTGGSPGQLELRAIDARLACIRQERRDARGRGTAVRDLHIGVVRAEYRAVEAQRSARQIQFETELEGLSLLGLECVE